MAHGSGGSAAPVAGESASEALAYPSNEQPEACMTEVLTCTVQVMNLSTHRHSYNK